MKGAYSLTGASHVLAVSGLHVGVVFIFSNFFLGLIFIRKFKRWRYLPLLFVLWGYAFVTGMSPSVVRATIMFSMMIVGMMTGRKGVTYNTIAASALLMLIYNPLYITDIGFQLSYTAVFSIVLLQDKISSLLDVKNVFLKKVWDLTAVSIAAQIGT
ncbi:MAG: ComEC/Rec2 family competence protein, partial [Paludibacteraceae bacterium]|nr:ComEC/Rec2 family competence protein [Paludibacteraceae bacterium]